MPRLKAGYITQREAGAWIREHHRHHPPARGDIFRVAAFDGEELVGVVQVGRPVARGWDFRTTMEVTRLCTHKDTPRKNTCSFLYSRAARIARDMGFALIVTYVLDSEEAKSLVAAGWQEREAGVRGRTWDCPTRPRTDKHPTEDKRCFFKTLDQ